MWVGGRPDPKIAGIVSEISSPPVAVERVTESRSIAKRRAVEVVERKALRFAHFAQSGRGADCRHHTQR